jgi:hypothetical protein
MPIPMDIPARFLPGVIAGNVIRYGCILCDARTGKIVGHLKQVLDISRSIPMNPIGAVSTVGQLIQTFATHHQLTRIQQTLDHLKLISSVGAVASVAGLGVSVAGFALVLRRLERLQQGLNQAMERIRAQVEKVQLKLDMLQMAQLRGAWEQLGGACQTNRSERSVSS